MSQTRIYSFGASRPTGNAQAASDQIYLAHRYRNDLCKLELLRREKYNAARRQHDPSIANAETAVAKLEKDLGDLRKRLKAANAESRNKRAADADKELAKLLKAQIAEAWKIIKARIKVVDALPVMREASKVISAWAGSAQKELRHGRTVEGVSRPPVEGAPPLPSAKLHWGTYGVVEQAAKTFASGTPPKFQRFDGGRLAIQIQKKVKRDAKTSGPLLDAMRLRLIAWCAAAGEIPKWLKKSIESAPKWKTSAKLSTLVDEWREQRATVPIPGDGLIFAELEAWQVKDTATILSVDEPIMRDLIGGTGHKEISIDGYSPAAGDKWKKHRGRVKLRCGDGADGEPIYATIPTKFHRAIPEDAKLKQAWLLKCRVGTQWKYRSQLVMTRDNWEKSNTAERGFVGIDLGWRLTDEGLRVAYWCGDDGREGELVLPAQLVEDFAEPERIKSIRDVKFNEIMAEFITWLKATKLPAWLATATETVHKWKGQNRLAVVCNQWFKVRDFPEGKAMLYRLEDWYRWDELKYNHESRLRMRLSGWREDIYRKFANQMRQEYRCAIIEDIDWRKMLEIPEAEEAKDDAAIRKYARAGAVGTLKQCLEESMREVRRLDPKNTTRKHFPFDHLSGEPNPENLMHTCTVCGDVFDQDQNAALNLLDSGRHARRWKAAPVPV